MNRVNLFTFVALTAIVGFQISNRVEITKIEQQQTQTTEIQIDIVEAIMNLGQEQMEIVETIEEIINKTEGF